MVKKLTAFILTGALAAAMCFPAMAASPVEYVSTEADSLPEADVSDGVLMEGDILSDEAEYLEEWYDETPLTFNVSYDDADLSGIVDSSGKYNGYDVMWADDAAAYCIGLMREHVVKTTENFLVAVPYSVSELGSSSPYTYAFNVYSDEFTNAFNDSLYVTGDGGDYLLYSMYGRPFYVTSSCKYFTSGDDGVALVWATPGGATYYTSESQEAEFVKQAQDVVSTLKKQVGDDATDYEKTCAAYDWIVKNVAYDYDNLGKSDYYLMYTAYGALVDGQAVCQGYANLFYYLLNELGVPCRIVAGTGYTGSASGPHAWNIVKLGGTWYHVDSTWGASYAQWYSGRYFFLQSEANFVNGINNTGHEMDYMTGIMYIDYTSSEFLSAHPISATKDYCDHTYTMKESRSASCGVYGYEVSVCTKCGETYEETFDKLDHDYRVVTEPTCEATGLMRCANCGDEEMYGPAGHDYVLIETVAPTCTQDGYDLYVCSVCGHEHETNFTDSLGGHDYSMLLTEDATHDADGYERFTCAVCGDSFTVTIPRIPYHVYGNGYLEAEYEDADDFTATCGYDYTAECDICGEQEYVLSMLHEFEEIEGHDGYFACKCCGVVVAAMGDTDEHEAVLDEDGEPYFMDTENDTGACGHEFEAVGAAAETCLHPGHGELMRCVLCGMIENVDDVTFTAPSGHSWAELSVPADCVTDGYKETHCENCGEVVMSSVEAVPAYGHAAASTDGYAATCTGTGLMDGTYCETCGAVLQEAEAIPAAGHDIVEIEAVTPTCTEGGRTEGWYCAACGEVFEESVELPANGHAWHTVSREISATCTEDGQKALIVCSVCDEVDPDADGSAIPAGHSLTHMEYKAPTEWEDGNIECWYCYQCDTFFLDENATQEAAFADTVLTWSGEDAAVAESDDSGMAGEITEEDGLGAKGGVTDESGDESTSQGVYVGSTSTSGSSDAMASDGSRTGLMIFRNVMIAACVAAACVVVIWLCVRKRKREDREEEE